MRQRATRGDRLTGQMGSRDGGRSMYSGRVPGRESANRMPPETPRSILRLRKRHDPVLAERPSAADGERLVTAQSLARGLLAGLVAAVLFVLLWVLVTDLAGRLLPWFTVLLGLLVGLAVRRGGQGFDWRFPLLAAGITLAGALAGIVVIAAGTTAAEFDTGTWTILRNVTTLTWPVFFDEVLTAADAVYAGIAAALAAWLSLRRLDRREFQAVRLYRSRTN